MPSNGFHSNGYALIRHIIKSHSLDLNRTYEDFDKSLGEELLTPTIIYTLDCLALIKGLGENLRTFAHVTGGGLTSNTARVIPDHLTAAFDRSTWSLPLGVELLANIGEIERADFEATWNCGIGMVAVVAPDSADLALRSLSARGMSGWVAGAIQARSGRDGATLEGAYQAR